MIEESSTPCDFAKSIPTLHLDQESSEAWIFKELSFISFVKGIKVVNSPAPTSRIEELDVPFFLISEDNQFKCLWYASFKNTFFGIRSIIPSIFTFSSSESL